MLAGLEARPISVTCECQAAQFSKGVRHIKISEPQRLTKASSKMAVIGPLVPRVAEHFRAQESG